MLKLENDKWYKLECLIKFNEDREIDEDGFFKRIGKELDTGFLIDDASLTIYPKEKKK